jgi:N-acetylglucosaminylphosphatidylinositol deacetylase
MLWLKWPKGELLQSKSSILLVTAHPDDEVMFFTPLLLGLVEKGHQVQILCLSTGNFGGLGHIRVEHCSTSMVGKFLSWTTRNCRIV